MSPADSKTLILTATQVRQKVERIAHEINEIRASLGGGIARQLQDMFPADEPFAKLPTVPATLPNPPVDPRPTLQQEFDRTLRQLAAGQTVDTTDPQPPTPNQPNSTPPKLSIY